MKTTVTNPATTATFIMGLPFPFFVLSTSSSRQFAAMRAPHRGAFLAVYTSQHAYRPDHLHEHPLREHPLHEYPLHEHHAITHFPSRIAFHPS